MKDEEYTFTSVWLTHKCGSRGYLNVRLNPKGNRYYCDKCGKARKGEFTWEREK
uniref:Uncharacterized protein n=1 Tax=viral metagenome TaxID=1070528 RepID=A0A6M3LND8_9ZZZZ